MTTSFGFSLTMCRFLARLAKENMPNHNFSSTLWEKTSAPIPTPIGWNKAMIITMVMVLVVVMIDKSLNIYILWLFLVSLRSYQAKKASFSVISWFCVFFIHCSPFMHNFLKNHHFCIKSWNIPFFLFYFWKDFLNVFFLMKWINHHAK